VSAPIPDMVLIEDDSCFAIAPRAIAVVGQW
jgi:hypothetical protein